MFKNSVFGQKIFIRRVKAGIIDVGLKKIDD